jgi:glycerol-3-phosphate dehydrogenase
LNVSPTCLIIFLSLSGHT